MIHTWVIYSHMVCFQSNTKSKVRLYIYFKKPIVVEYYKSYVCYVIDNCK